MVWIRDTGKTTCLLAFSVLLIACGADQEAVTPMLPVDGARWPLPTEDTDDPGSTANNSWLNWGTGGTATEANGSDSHGNDLEGSGATSDDPGTVVDGQTPTDEKPAPGETIPIEAPAPLLTRRLLQYWEGAGSEKMVQIEGAAGLSPSPCTVEIYSNGGTEPWRRVTLPDEFPDPVITLCSSAVTDPTCSHDLSGSLFNGNDALVIRCGDTVMDSFGRVGEDPGVSWRGEGADAASTEGQHLVRCAPGADLQPFDPFFLDEAWVSTDFNIMEALSSCEVWRPRGAGGAGGAMNP